MVTYLDTQAGGANNDLVQGGTFEWPLSQGTKFYLNVANNLIPGQGSGQNVTFKVQDVRGSETYTVLYGRSIKQPVMGHLVTTVPATLPASPNADLHIVLSDSAVDLNVQQQQASTSTGSTTLNSPTISFKATGAQTIYTVPPNFQGDVIVMNWTTNDTIYIQVNSGGNLSNLTGNQTGTGTLGQGKGDTVVINPPKHLQSGDLLQVVDNTPSGTGGVIGYTIHQYPL